MRKLTEDEKEVIAMIRDGWRPFPFQVDEQVAKRLLRRGIVTIVNDQNGRAILVPTTAGSH